MFKNDFYPEALDQANQAFETGELSSEQHLSEVEAHYLGQLASEQALSEDMDRLEAEYQGLKSHLQTLKSARNNLDNRNDHPWAPNSKHYQADMAELARLDQQIEQLEQQLTDLGEIQ